MTVHAKATPYTHGEWLEKFETELLKHFPRLKSCLDRRTGEFYYLKGYSPRDAVREVINEWLQHT